MATTNDVPGDCLTTKASPADYRSNYDAIFKKPVATVLPEWPNAPETDKLVQDVCFECRKEIHSMGCGSKSVYDAYITLHESIKWGYFTDLMLTELDNKVRLEMAERKFKSMFDNNTEQS